MAKKIKKICSVKRENDNADCTDFVVDSKTFGSLGENEFCEIGNCREPAYARCDYEIH